MMRALSALRRKMRRLVTEVAMTPQKLMKAARRKHWHSEKMQEPRKQSMYCLVDGPMYYLGQKIVRAMQDAGYPAKISECYRSPERQRRLKVEGRSKAGPYESPHQYYEAVDIIHPSMGWNVSEAYWDALATCVRIVAERHDVQLTHGHFWRFRDSAHVELTDWRKFRDEMRARVNERGQHGPPGPGDLWRRFGEVLPSHAKRAEREGRAPKINPEMGLGE